jgi:hypothetical protein
MILNVTLTMKRYHETYYNNATTSFVTRTRRAQQNETPYQTISRVLEVEEVELVQVDEKYIYILQMVKEFKLLTSMANFLLMLPYLLLLQPMKPVYLCCLKFNFHQGQYTYCNSYNNYLQ